MRDAGGFTGTMRRVGECGVDLAGADNKYLGLNANTVAMRKVRLSGRPICRCDVTRRHMP